MDMTSFNFDAAQLHNLLSGVVSPVGGDLVRRGDAVADQARKNVLSLFTQRTRNLYNSIESTAILPKRDAAGLYIEIGLSSSLEYADYLENGSPAHTIRPTGRWQLRSDGPRADPAYNIPLREPQWIVNHPGTRAYHFMRDAISAAAI